MSEEKKNVQETEEAVYKEVEAEEASDRKRLKAAIVVGITEDNQMFVNLEGYEQNLVNIEGLLGYARKHVDTLWDDRLKAKPEEE